MPTRVTFVGGQKLVLSEDFEKVNQQLSQHDGGLFNAAIGGQDVRVTVYKASVAYIEEFGEAAEPLVAQG